ncbi:MAG: hypothetical protein APF78_09325 [Sphingomonadales bacterium BRH_c3]|nr:MAG: hypothetical protein APF78_09325 [Sphingomonadales bacterium BRH_c3]
MTLEEARKAARYAFAEARANEAEGRKFSEARREARHAQTPARLEGIRAKDPDLANLIEQDLQWLAQTTRGFAEWPFSEKIAYWYWLFTIDHDLMPEPFNEFLTRREKGLKREPNDWGKDPGLKSRRGHTSQWQGLRAAAFILLDWHEAKMGKTATIKWLADELALIEPNMSHAPASGQSIGKDLAAKFRHWWLDEKEHRTELGKSPRHS